MLKFKMENILNDITGVQSEVAAHLQLKAALYPMTTLRHGEARPPFNMPMPVGWYIVRAVQEASHC